MARQSGHIKIEGTIGGLCFYRMDGVYYVRQKSSLSRKRVLKDPRFARSRAAAGRFGLAVKLASQVYRRMSQEHKGHGVIGQMTAVANRFLCNGSDREEALLLLEREYLSTPDVSAKPPIKKVISAAERLSQQHSRPQRRRELHRFLAVYPASPECTITSHPLPRGAPVAPLHHDG